MRPILGTVACAALAALAVYHLRAPEREALAERKGAPEASTQTPRAGLPPEVSRPSGADAAAWRAAGARLLTPSSAEPGEGPASVASPALERALEEEGDDPAWTHDVQRSVIEALAEDPQVRLEAVRCTPTFCRLRLTKPIDSRLDWPEIDQKLAPIARGETLFSALPHGVMTTAHVYFSALDSSLPLDQTRPGEADDDG